MSHFPTHQRAPLLSVYIETRDDTIEIVRARGEVDLLTAPELERYLDIALDKQPSAIIVDLTEVEFLGSYGMSVLMQTKDRLPHTTRLAVVADGPSTSRPLTVVGLADVLNVCATIDAALAAVADENGDM
jgi:anti-sigma B factor antagonist